MNFEQQADELSYTSFRLTKDLMIALATDGDSVSRTQGKRQAEKLALVLWHIQEASTTLGDSAEWT